MGLRTIIESVESLLHAQVAFAGTSVLYGAKEVTKQTNQGTGRANRVVFAPADGPGSFGPPRSPGQPASIGEKPLSRGSGGRSLHTWIERISVHCWARAADEDRGDQLAHDDAARLLTMAVVAAIYETAHGAYEISEPTWVKTPVETRYGSTLVFTLAIQLRVEARPKMAAVLVDAATDVKVLDNTETVLVPPA
jgi:hypothetical protein